MVNTFQNALDALHERAASPSDRQLVTLIAEHGHDEGALLARYEQVAGRVDEPSIRYLVNLILEDEQRHHRVLIELANAIALDGVHDTAPAVPNIPSQKVIDVGLAAETAALLAAERRDRDELKRLRRKLKDFSETTLWTLLVDLMILDTEKHARILETIQHRLVSPKPR
jgi:rubrerythrin